MQREMDQRFTFFPLQHVYPKAGVTLPSFIKFGSWIGGDRDGNPFGEGFLRFFTTFFLAHTDIVHT